jgi:hypothetical protein
MKTLFRSLLIAAAVSLLPVAPADLAQAATAHQAGPRKAKRHTTPRWRGYGFLPGYRPQVPHSIPLRTAAAGRYEMRYWHYGQYLYGWGRPQFFRGRWNGGGFGPCWTTTPIGMMWTCGR